MATDSAVARDNSVAVGRDVRGNIYLTYQSAPGPGLLTQQQFERTLDDYLRWVSRVCGTARLYGLKSLPTTKPHKVSTLSDVFVPLSLRRFVPLLRQEIEAAASAEGLDSTQAYLRLVEEKRREGEEVALAALLTIQNRVALIGGAGSGKSTLLRYLAFLLAKAALDMNRRPAVQLPEGKSSLVPILIPLRNFREYREFCAQVPHQAVDDPRSGTLAGFIPWYLQHNGSPLSVSKDFVERLLQGGGCLLMLDGLDEVVSRDMRGQVRQEVENLVTSLPPGNVVLVTAREAGYRENAVFGDDFVRLDVQPLDEEQIRVLVASWCRLLYPGEEKQRAQELLIAIEQINERYLDQGLPPLVSTPLMTTMVVSVKWGEAKLPRERARLYEACVNVILQAQYNPEDKAGTVLVNWGGDPDEQHEWLSVLALAMHEGGQASAVVSEQHVRKALSQKLAPESLQQFLEAVRHRGGLLEERAELFQFVHLTFQEFLTARWFANERERVWPRLQPHLTDPWWREVFLLTYGCAQMLHRTTANEYLHWLSTQDGVGEQRLAGLELAGAALLERENPKPEDLQRQAKDLAGALTDPKVAASAALRARAGDTLARLGDPRFCEDAWYLPAEERLGFVKVSAGAFFMGEGDAQHEVTLPYDYYIARYPVTVAQFRAFVEDEKYEPKDGDCLQELPNQPVQFVKWHDARAYCQWLTKQLHAGRKVPDAVARQAREEGWVVTLPSEAEWEKAARGTEGWIYPWGNDWREDHANTAEAGIGRPSAVGSFPQGASPFGCQDMAGNVWEWTRSLWGKDPSNPEFGYPYNPKDPRREDLTASDNVLRVLRGGSYGNTQGNARCAARYRYGPYYRNAVLGFRMVVRPCVPSEL